MSTLTAPPASAAGDDAGAIAELEQIVQRQRAAFLKDPSPSLQERQELVGALAMMIMGHRAQIEQALSAAFGAPPALPAALIAVLGGAGRAVSAAEHPRGGMAGEDRPADPALY